MSLACIAAVARITPPYSKAMAARRHLSLFRQQA
jgi:hypothetical protein